MRRNGENMINEIAPHIYKNEMLYRAATQDDYIFIFQNDQILLKALNIPQISDVNSKIDFKLEELEYLFSIDDIGYYLLRDKNTENLCALDPKLEFVNIQVYRTLEYNHIAFAIMTAGQLYRWMEKHKFCGCCGGKMSKSTTERALICDSCGETIYVTISPAVAVAIVNGDKILMARSVYGTFRRFALIAGYMEIGESFEDTIKREVMEEVGLKVKNLRFYKSQPWSVSDSLMIGYYADLDGDDTITCQESEIAEAKWFTREEIDPDLSQISLSYEMIDRFRLGTYPK